jgi:HEAT repeat protein
MNDHTSVRNDSRPFRRLGFRKKNLTLVIAISALLVWSGWRIWDDLSKGEDTRVFEDTLGRLQSTDASERWRAAGSLYIVNQIDQIEPAIAALVRALNDQDPQVKDASARSLGSLVRRLRIPAGSDVTAEPQLVRKITEHATTALAQSLSDSAECVRVGSAVGIGMLSTQPNSAPSGGGMRSAIMVGDVTANTPSWKPPRELAEGLKNGKEKWSRITAQAYYGYIDYDPPLQLVAALTDESPAVRLQAVRSLGNYPLKLDSAIPTLLSMLEKEDAEARSISEEILRKAWPTAVVIPNLATALKSDDAHVRAMAALLLGRIGPEATSAVPTLVAILIESLESKDETLAEDAAKALAKFGKQAAAAIPRLRSLKENKKSAACEAAAVALDAIEAATPPKQQTSPRA